MIGDRLRQLRETKHLSQGDIEKRTGLLRWYVSRVENGHTVPNVATLEKLAAAFDVPLWKIFYESDQPARPVLPSRDLEKSEIESVKDRKFYLKLARLLGRMTEKDRHLLFFAVQKMAGRRRTRQVKSRRQLHSKYDKFATFRTPPSIHGHIRDLLGPSYPDFLRISCDCHARVSSRTR